LFNWIYEIEPTVVWRPVEQLGNLFIVWLCIGSLIFGALLTIGYAILFNGIPGKSLFAKGIYFSFLVWLIGIFPCYFENFMTMTIPKPALLYQVFSSIVVVSIKGIVIAHVYGLPH
jgi:hypothetical protein